MTCVRCENTGAVTLRYKSGEAPDVAICWCRTGELLRRAEATSPGVLAMCFAWADRVVWLEDAADPDDLERWGSERPTAPAVTVAEDALRRFGRTHKAGLGGQQVTP